MEACRPSPSQLPVRQSGMTDQSFEDYDLLLTRQSEDYNGGVAQWSQEDPDVDDDLDVDDESPDSNSLMPVSARLRSLEDRSCAPRTFKFGSCPHHGTALRPHIWSASSKKAGRGALVCSKFWKRDETTNKPTCWYFKEVTLAEAQDWPDSTGSTNPFKLAFCEVADKFDRVQHRSSKKKPRCPTRAVPGVWQSLGCRCSFQQFHGSLGCRCRMYDVEVENDIVTGS